MAVRLNKAKEVLQNPEEKQKYDDALKRFNLIDGKVRDATFNQRLREASIVRKGPKRRIVEESKEP